MKPPWTRRRRQVAHVPLWHDLYDLDISPDGQQLAASIGEIADGQSVHVPRDRGAAQGDASAIAEYDFGAAVPNSFVFSPDGRCLYGSSYYTGVSNIFRYDFASETMAAVTNRDTGFFRPVPLGGDSLIVFRYTGDGFVPARITAVPIDDINPITFFAEQLVEEHPVIKTWNVGSPAKIPFDTMPKRTGTYKLAGGLRRESFYPILQGYKSSPGVGLRLNLSDPLQLNRLHLSAAYSPDTGLPSSERVHLAAAYERFDWRASAR